MRDAIASVEYNACSAAGSVEGQDGLDGAIESWNIEGLKEDLGGCISVCTWVEWWFCEEDWMLLKGSIRPRMRNTHAGPGLTSSLSVLSSSP